MESWLPESSLSPPLQFVFGMHRSGTSAMAGLLSQMGLREGASAMRATPENSMGYFENDAVVGWNERLLERLGSSWHDPRPISLRIQSLTREVVATLQRDLADLLAGEFSGIGIGLLKDPRLCRLAPFWKPIIFECARPLVMMLRYPASVAASLQMRNGFSPEKSLTLWLANNLEMERSTRDFRREWVNYETFMRQPEDICIRMSDVLELRVNDPHSLVKASINPELCHHQGDWPEVATWLRDLIEEAYQTLKTGSPDGQTMDQIFQRYAERVGWLPDDLFRLPRASGVSAPESADSPQSTIQLFFQKGGIFSEEASIRKEVASHTWSCVRFSDLGTKGMDPKGRLRIDPMAQPGEVRIAWIRICTEPDETNLYLAESKQAFEALQLGSGVRHSFEGDGLRLVASNDDPQFLLPEIEMEWPNAFALELRIKIEPQATGPVPLPTRPRWQEIPGWFNWREGQEEAVRHFPDGSCFVEVGTFLGRSLCSLAEVASGSGRTYGLIGVDTCTGSGPEGSHGKDYHQAAVQQGRGTFAGQLHRNILACGFSNVITLIVASSETAARLFPEQSLDWVHLDARHDYPSVRADILAWLPKIKSGGWLTGDDYDPAKWGGVVQAVSELLPSVKPWLHLQWRYTIP